MRIALVLIALIALVAVGRAGAWNTTVSLDGLASLVAMRPVKVRCYDNTEPESPDYYGAWGYVQQPIGKQTWMAVDSTLCVGADDINNLSLTKWSRALGVLVIVHEAYHLRRWGAAGDEAKVECKAIRHWKVGARLLGASEETVKDLLPTAVALHYRLTQYADWQGNRPYYLPGCVVPKIIEDGEDT